MLTIFYIDVSETRYRPETAYRFLKIIKFIKFIIEYTSNTVLINNSFDYSQNLLHMNFWSLDIENP